MIDGNRNGHGIADYRTCARFRFTETVVMNGSQRCEMHNLALFRWVGWAWSVCRVAVAILVKSDSARTFEDLPPTQRCIDSVYI